ncbi:MAG: hypothetical protein II702_06500 [Clostridia bacterium]|nr:hypothetical protein [Clostridia bacterium]
MKTFKKILHIVAALAIGAVALYILCVSSFAFSETEYNDSIDTANTVPVNEAIYASYDSSRYEDDDYFKFTIPADGTVSITMNHDYYDWGTAMQFWLSEDGTASNIIYSYGLSWRAETQTTKRIGLPAGTYYIETHWWPDDYDIPYNMTINYSQTDTFEKEYNNGIKSASAVPVNTEIGGHIWGHDIDYYKFTVPSDGAVSFTFNQPYESYDPETDVRLFSYNGTEEEYFEYYGFGRASETLTSHKIGLKQGEYYFTVGGCGYLDTYEDFEYTFTVNFEASDYWEKENNDGIKTASKVVNDTVYSGTISSGDPDYYEFTIESAKPVSFEITHEYFTSGGEIHIEISSYNGTEEIAYGNFDTPGTAETSSTGEIELQAGTYLVKLSTYSRNSFGYGLKVKTEEEPVEETTSEEPTVHTTVQNPYSTEPGTDGPEVPSHTNVLKVSLIAVCCLTLVACVTGIILLAVKKKRW